MSNPALGFVGLGVMGLPMVARRRGPRVEHRRHRASLGKEVQEVALGENGLIEGFAEGSLPLDTSSSQPWVTPQTAETLASRGVSQGSRLRQQGDEQS